MNDLFDKCAQCSGPLDRQHIHKSKMCLCRYYITDQYNPQHFCTIECSHTWKMNERNI